MATSIVLPERFPLTPGCRPPPGPLRGLLCREAVLMATRPLRLAETRLEKLKSQTAMGKLSVSRHCQERALGTALSVPTQICGRSAPRG